MGRWGPSLIIYPLGYMIWTGRASRSAIGRKLTNGVGGFARRARLGIQRLVLVRRSMTAGVGVRVASVLASGHAKVICTWLRPKIETIANELDQSCGVASD